MEAALPEEDDPRQRRAPWIMADGQCLRVPELTNDAGEADISSYWWGLQYEEIAHIEIRCIDADLKLIGFLQAHRFSKSLHLRTTSIEAYDCKYVSSEMVRIGQSVESLTLGCILCGDDFFEKDKEGILYFVNDDVIVDTVNECMNQPRGTRLPYDPDQFVRLIERIYHNAEMAAERKRRRLDSRVQLPSRARILRYHYQVCFNLRYWKGLQGTFAVPESEEFMRHMKFVPLDDAEDDDLDFKHDSPPPLRPPRPPPIVAKRTVVSPAKPISASAAAVLAALRRVKRPSKPVAVHHMPDKKRQKTQLDWQIRYAADLRASADFRMEEL
jgi:hypothetical protein